MRSSKNCISAALLKQPDTMKTPMSNIYSNIQSGEPYSKRFKGSLLDKLRSNVSIYGIRENAKSLEKASKSPNVVVRVVNNVILPEKP